jgi:hypothetical protein
MEPVFLFETLLFYNNAPCYYKVFAKGEIFFGEPTPHHYYAKTNFPHFIVRGEKLMQVEGVYDQGMIKQILQELEKHLQKLTPQ